MIQSFKRKELELFFSIGKRSGIQVFPVSVSVLISNVESPKFISVIETRKPSTKVSSNGNVTLQAISTKRMLRTRDILFEHFDEMVLK